MGYVSIQLLQKFDVLLHEDCTRTNNYMNSHRVYRHIIYSQLTNDNIQYFYRIFWKRQRVAKIVIIVVSKKELYGISYDDDDD